MYTVYYTKYMSSLNKYGIKVASSKYFGASVQTSGRKMHLVLPEDVTLDRNMLRMLF